MIIDLRVARGQEDTRLLDKPSGPAYRDQLQSSSVLRDVNRRTRLQTEGVPKGLGDHHSTDRIHGDFHREHNTNPFPASQTSSRRPQARPHVYA